MLIHVVFQEHSTDDMCVIYIYFLAIFIIFYFISAFIFIFLNGLLNYLAILICYCLTEMDFSIINTLTASCFWG